MKMVWNYCNPGEKRPPFVAAQNRLLQNMEYTKLRWLLTIGGLVFYIVDIGTDVALALKYYVLDGRYILSALTLGFVLVGMLVTQIFSYAWYKDDINDVFINPQGISTISGISKNGIAVFHVCGAGIFTRYYHLLKNGFRVVWTDSKEESTTEVHHRLFCQATDLSMLKLFEAFLESAPQLLLQIHIALHQCDVSIMQYLSMVLSCFNISWALVDYRRCLRRSLPQVREMPSGLPTAIYLLYKLCTISSHVLSYSLLLMLSPYSVIALAVLWLLGTTWSHLLQTNFCSSRSLEVLYRAVVGFILMFTFFNVKGQSTRASMIVYYFLYSLINMTTPILLVLLIPELQTAMFFLAITGVIFGGSLLGLVFLLLYYLYLHPREKKREADEVDGLKKEAETGRIRHFLQP
uniref:XK-related protein 9 n=1 Tax=Doryrhamphus excisus TaxID=161450 RepID=UPI0025ADE9C0|nr:XK-related protein 9 [Doryrhamphus excisus]